STSVDLPEPMSPVTRQFSPRGSSAQTRPSKVPQLNTSKRCRRKPALASLDAKSSRGSCGAAVMGCEWTGGAAGPAYSASLGRPRGPASGRSPALEVRPVLREALLELVQPLRVHEGLQNPSHLELILLPAQPPQEPELDDAVDVGVDAVDELRLVGAARQEELHEIDDLRARKDQARVAAGRVVLGELLAQQRKQQAHRETELAALHEPRHLLAVVGRPLPQVCVAFGLVEHELEAEHGRVIAHLRLELEQRVPELRALILVQHSFK